jgi:hypothetical protein
MLIDCPILILAFNRADLFEQTLGEVWNAGARNIWVSLDGARENNSSDLRTQQIILKVCYQYKLPLEKLRLSINNQGCRDGVNAGISWFFSYNLQGIIIEDDISISVGYLGLMAKLLGLYSNNKSIFSISSHCDPELLNLSCKDLVLFEAPLCRVWGWATWADRWSLHLQIIQNKLRPNPFKCFFSLPKYVRTADASLRLFNCQSGVLNTWDYEWNLSHLLCHASSITPRALFCLNRGFRDDATHTLLASPPWLEMTKFEYEIYICSPYEFTDKFMLLHEKCGFPLTTSWKRELINLFLYILRDYLKITRKYLLRFYFSLRC